jgi:hypothetical protein
MEHILFEKALHFVNTIGIETRYEDLKEEACFLPGFLIAGGKIIIDKPKMKFPGDLLHEAAHIAVVSSAERSLLHGENIGRRKDAGSEEMMSIAWSYAACIHLNIDPHFVFHENGYKGAAESIIDNFANGNYFGVPVLQWLGMTTISKNPDDINTYPSMLKWLRD